MTTLRYAGLFNEANSFGQAARAHALALAGAGVSVAIDPVVLSTRGPVLVEPDTARFPELGLLPRAAGGEAVEILHVTPPLFPVLRARAYSIGLTVSHTSSLPPRWLPHLAAVDEIWVPSRHAAAAFTEAGRRPVMVMPHPVALPAIPAKAPLPDIPDDLFLFLAVLEWQDRKNPDGLIRAFRAAFAGRSDVALLIKIGTLFCRRRRLIERAISRLTRSLWRRNAPRVYVIMEPLAAATIQRLYARADAFVSLHRAEAFGLCIAEAMAAARPVVATAYSGNLDYTDAESALLVPCRMVPLRERYARPNPYVRGMRWAEPRLEAAVEALRACTNNPALRERRARRGRARVRELLDPDRLGGRMKQRLDAIG